MAGPEIVSLRAFARDRQVSDYAVRKGIASGRIPRECIGRNKQGQPVITDLAGARAAWDANAAKTPKTSQTGQLAKMQAALTAEKIEEKRFDNERRRGEWIRQNDAVKERFEQGRMTRERVLNVTPRLAPALAAETDVAKIAAMLDAELRAALESVADELGKRGA